MTLLAAFMALSCSALFPTFSDAALVAQSTSTVGSLRYDGLGAVDGGIGSGIYTLGTCAFAAGTTTCTLNGSYVETVQSTHSPGQAGTFTLAMAYPGSGPSPVIAQSIAAGSDILQFSTVGSAIFTLRLLPTTGGEISGLYPAPVFADSIGFAAFLDPTNYACTGLSATQICGIGQVGLIAGATVIGGVNPLQFSVPLAAPPSSSNYQGLWWNSPAGSESGWGINFAHQGDTIFASWFTYDLSGKGLWLVMTATKTGNGVYAGTLYQLTGPPFDVVPFPALGSPGGAAGTPIGIGTLTFTDVNSGSFAYTVNGISQTKPITREAFGTVPTCTYSAQPNLALATNYQDLWWAVPGGSESGWGVNLTHQGDTIFASWFTFDHDRMPMWVVMSAPKTAPSSYTGTLYRLTGPPFNAVPFPPLGTPGGAIGTSVGTATFTFSDGNTGTFAYTVNGVTQTKNITRELFNPPAGTVCQ